MRSLSDTIERLARLRAAPSPADDGQPARLLPLDGFGTNPGGLTGFMHVPPASGQAPALVVVLHGCLQNAAVYDACSGWSRLAEDNGFAVLFPEQSRGNNGNRCFNWFSLLDTKRDHGEVLSIRQMIGTMIDRHGIDPRRVFVTGLSAGGAMASAMLATYPEIFAGGTIIAGLPYGVASSIPDAFDRMRGHGLPSDRELQSKLKDGAAHSGPWPTISVWHGTDDKTVADSNARATIAQWRGVLGAQETPDLSETNGRHSRKIWTDATGRTVMEYHSIGGMGHGTPLDPRLGYEKAGDYMLDVGISSTLASAQSWNLIGASPVRAKARPGMEKDPFVRPAQTGTAAGAPSGADGIQQIIEKALRSAGLLK